MEKPTTKEVIDYYKETRAAPMFLTSFATAITFRGDELEMDIERDGEEVAVPLKTIGDSANMNSDDYFTTRKIKPAPYKEAFSLSAGEVDKHRIAGHNPYDSFIFQETASARAINGAAKLTKKVSRSVELQASQMYQLGTTTLNDGTGGQRFQAVWPTDVTQFPASGTGDWTDPDDGLIISDIGEFLQVLKDLGNTGMEFDLIMGKKAIRAWIANNKVQGILDNRRMTLGSIDRPEQTAAGGTRHGSFSFDGFVGELWGYDASYILGGTRYRYLDEQKIICRAKDCVTRLASAGVERFGGADSSLLQYVPSTLSGPFVVSPFAVANEDKTALTISIASRAVHYPNTVNKFGCFTTDAA
jgi:hypothetical protein